MREKKSGGRLVCVKQIHQVHHPRQAFAGAGHSKSLGVEVELMKKLRHPNLIRLLTSFVGPSPLCQQHIVMEYWSGGDLHTYLKTFYRNGRQRNGLGEEKIWYWFVQLALGLHHMHQQHVLHRDIKTANIFLSDAGYLVLGDFGIARALTNGDMAGTVIGTPLYMAPEVHDGKDYSFSSDVWALGCVLYELYTGKPPFTASNTPQLLNKICHADYIPIQKGGNLAISRLPTFVASMLNTNPELRPSVDQLLRDPITRVHIRRYWADRLLSTSMAKEERRVMIQQMTVLGEDPRIVSSATKNEEATAHAYSRHQARSTQHREDVEKHLMGVRERERQEQLLFALEKLQQLRLQLPVSQPENVLLKGCNGVVNAPTAPTEQDSAAASHESPRGDLWRDPVRAAGGDRIQPRVRANLGRSNSVPKELAFTGIPRLGVLLTEMAKTFAARQPVCRDVRILKKREAANAAERYKRQLDAMYTPRQRRDDQNHAPGPAQHSRRMSLNSERAAARNTEDQDTDAAILLSMATLRQALE